MKSIKPFLIVLSISFIAAILVQCTGAETEEPNELTIEKISFKQPTLNIVLGTTIDLDSLLEITGVDSAQAKFTFTSSDNEVVKIEDNILETVDTGQSTITATEINTNLKDSVLVTIVDKYIPLESISFSEASIEVDMGSSFQLTVTKSPSDNTNTNDIKWSLSLVTEDEVEADYYATIDEKGIITGINECNECLELTATTTEGDKTISTSTLVSVISNYIPIESLSFTEVSLKIGMGEVSTLTVTKSPSDNTNTSNITWALSLVNEEKVTVDYYATIDQNGTIKGINECKECLEVTATIVEGDNKISASALVSIEYIPVSSISIVPNNFSMLAGETKQLEVKILPENASDKTISWNVTAIPIRSKCEVLNEEIISPLALALDYATIDQKGLLTANTSLNQVCEFMQVTAISARKEVTTVVDFDISKLVITDVKAQQILSPYKLDCPSTPITLEARFYPENTKQNVVWKSDSDLISIDAGGTMSFKDPTATATVNITATMSSGQSTSIQVVTSCTPK
ncbi:Ig-like domain-containing protein [Reichenbachiella versicolor]|uniref:Ig-like domain-containing protein n=1 Tax=Reichenbachiella versicolor TaxID=1821036 RepID=UPI000D6E8037|nr:Ig-like domain-containing protein [Reichenbachiella versicolor]